MSAAARTFAQSSLNVTTETAATIAFASLDMKETVTTVKGFHMSKPRLLIMDRLMAPATTALKTLTAMKALVSVATVSSGMAKIAE